MMNAAENSAIRGATDAPKKSSTKAAQTDARSRRPHTKIARPAMVNAVANGSGRKPTAMNDVFTASGTSQHRIAGALCRRRMAMAEIAMTKYIATGKAVMDSAETPKIFSHPANAN